MARKKLTPEAHHAHQIELARELVESYKAERARALMELRAVEHKLQEAKDMLRRLQEAPPQPR